MLRLDALVCGLEPPFEINAADIFAKVVSTQLSQPLPVQFGGEAGGCFHQTILSSVRYNAHFLSKNLLLVPSPWMERGGGGLLLVVSV
jgi:hypothetical protein